MLEQISIFILHLICQRSLSSLCISITCVSRYLFTRALWCLTISSYDVDTDAAIFIEPNIGQVSLNLGILNIIQTVEILISNTCYMHKFLNLATYDLLEKRQVCKLLNSAPYNYDKEKIEAGLLIENSNRFVCFSVYTGFWGGR